MGDIDLPYFFAWCQEGILRLKKGKVPRQTVVETESRTVDPDLLAAMTFKRARGYAPPRYLTPPVPTRATLDKDGLGVFGSEFDPRLVALAREWAGAGGGRMAAGRSRDCEAPSGAAGMTRRRRRRRAARTRWRFSFSSLAAATTMRLRRQLACCCARSATRRASWRAFTRPPNGSTPSWAKRPSTGATFMLWTEVLVPPQDWIVVEPTPGYEVLRPETPWLARAWTAARASARSARQSSRDAPRAARPRGRVLLLPARGRRPIHDPALAAVRPRQVPARR